MTLFVDTSVWSLALRTDRESARKAPEVAALRDALQEGLSISSAISRAREGLAADANSLVGALASYERERADAAIEAALEKVLTSGIRTPDLEGTATTQQVGEEVIKRL